MVAIKIVRQVISAPSLNHKSNHTTKKEKKKMSSTPVFTSSESQRRWREHMKHNYISNHSIRPCVFQVPDNLKETKPEAYTPQLVGLGPYHHFLPQVQHMESQKRAAVLDYLEIVNINDFIDLVEKSPDDFQPKIRSCYDRYLDLDRETLAWVVIVDGVFLLNLIYSFLHPEELERNKVYSNVGGLITDVLMLENQIPIVLILEMREFLQQSFSVDSDEELFDKFHLFCKEQSPLQLTEDAVSRGEAYDKNKHVLHFMYQMIVKNKRADYKPETMLQDNRDDDDDPDVTVDENSKILRKDQEENRATLGTRVRGIAREAASQGGEILEQAIEEFSSALSHAKTSGIKVSGNIEKVSYVLRNFQKVLNLNLKKDPLGDRIDIPSASRLNAIIKIKFRPLPKCCGIGNISLDGKKRILYLPVITLRPNSEVILRNLVAYEATSKMGSTQIRAYVDLMCGIIKSEKDVKLLQNAGIIKGELPEGEIVRMCNGIKKSDEKPDEKSNVHSTVKDVNDNFNSTGIVKACRSIMKGFAGFVKSLKPLFPVLVLLFLAFQSFCEIFDCRRRGSSYGGAALHNLYLGDLDPESRLGLPRKVYRY